MPPLLELDTVEAGYGRIKILRNLSLAVPEGSVVALIGPNGVGKTTTLRAIAGLLPVTGGHIRFAGRRIDGQSPYAIARRGLTLMPEGRGVFPGMTVDENLSVAARSKRGRSDKQRRQLVDGVIESFPRLGERRNQLAGTMSGGEQQMLALGRAFLTEPRLLLLDEISMGLAPVIVKPLYEHVHRLRDQGVTIVMVEQFLTYALELADIGYVMRKGSVSFVGDAGELRASRVGESLVAG